MCADLSLGLLPPLCRSLRVSKVALAVDKRQYHDMLYLAAGINAFDAKEALDKLRPTESATDDPSGWWHYAVRAIFSCRRSCVAVLHACTCG